MNELLRFRETLATYRKYGWTLARVLMRPETLAGLPEPAGAPAAGAGAGEVASAAHSFEGVPVSEAAFDAMWLKRPSHEGREAWELRLVAETPYALFELFEADEAEEDREDVRREMEARMREYVGK